MKFSELLQNNLARNPGEQQKQAAKQFPVAVQGSHFKLWSAKNVASKKGKRLVIGAAVYAPAELALMDRLNNRLSTKPGLLTAEAFDVLDCANQSDIDIRVPGIARVYQTPVVGLWEDGELRHSEQGSKALELIRKIFG